MDLSVLIPTYQRPDKLAVCLRALANQTLATDRYEVLVGLDGSDPASERAGREAWGACKARLVIEECPRSGLNPVRNRMMDRATGKYLVSLNDDVEPCRTFLESHLNAHKEAEAKVGEVVISGYSPWKQQERPTLFDRLVGESSMIFFFDQMTPEKVAEKGRWHDWGFRHCYGLNFSTNLERARESGKFTAFHLAYGYDDVELAYRLKQRYGMQVLYRPEAEALHDHRYGAEEVLRREFKLGHAAWHFAERDPSFCEALFRRDIRSREELAYSREYLQRERVTAAWVRETFLNLEKIPGHDASGPAEAAMMRMVYLHHLVLKRWMWRAGLVAGAEGRAQDVIELPQV
jgi:GT2 family glycosyltransferase